MHIYKVSPKVTAGVNKNIHRPNLKIRPFGGKISFRDVSGAAEGAAPSPLRNKTQTPTLTSAASAFWSPSATSLRRSGSPGCLRFVTAGGGCPPSAPPAYKKHSRGRANKTTWSRGRLIPFCDRLAFESNQTTVAHYARSLHSVLVSSSPNRGVDS